MSNSETEHSKQLRIKTSAEWQKKQRACGNKKQLSMLLDSKIARDFDDICKSLKLSKPQTLKVLIEIYQKHAIGN